MDIFRFLNPTAPTLMEQGQIVNGLKSKLWIERYRDSGEFKFVANLDSNIRDQLPIGSFVSHINSYSIMIVENHELTENKGKPTELTITGRSYDTFMEQRVVGTMGKTFPNTSGQVDYKMTARTVGAQVQVLIYNHLSAQSDTAADSLPYIDVVTSLPPGGVPLIDNKTVKRGSLYQRVHDLMPLDDLGLRITRPGIPGFNNPTETNIVIHKGTDRRDTVIFAYDSDELDSAEYVWSNKKYKNAALVTGKYVEVWVTLGQTKYDRRTMFIDASDIDKEYTAPPSGQTLTDIANEMTQRGLDVLSSQINVALTKADVTKEDRVHIFRKDFNIGDIVTVMGDYNESAAMRITEYVEIDDETGSKGYPTFRAL